MKMLLSFLNKFRQHRAVLAPIRLTSFFSMAALLFAMTVVTPTTTFAQRGSTSKGGVERNSKAQSRKSGIAARSTSSRSDSRATPSQSSSKRAQSSSKSRSRASGTSRSAVRSINRSGSAGGSGSVSDSRTRASSRGSVGSSGRSDRIVINGRRARLSLPHVRATYRSHGNSHVRFRTRIHVPSRRVVYHRPHTRINVHLTWPWTIRYQRHWSPRYTYRQVVVVRSDWGRSHRTSRIEMETTYRHQVRWANDEYAVLDVSIEKIALYDNGRYIGMVDRIPEHLSRIEATVFRNGDIAFDRDVFLVGDRRDGFELISTSFQDGYAGSGSGWDQDMAVGRVYLRSQKVGLHGTAAFTTRVPIEAMPR